MNLENLNLKELTSKESASIDGGDWWGDFTDGVSDAVDAVGEAISDAADAVGEALEDFACGVSRYGC